jgi:hypothetical protein
MLQAHRRNKLDFHVALSALAALQVFHQNLALKSAMKALLPSFIHI